MSQRLRVLVLYQSAEWLTLGIERSRWRGIEVVAAGGVPAASSSVVGALGRNRLVQSDQR
jgi:hypothetical protein